MSMMKRFLEDVALREFGEVTDRTLDLATPIAQKELNDNAEESARKKEKTV